MADGACFFPYPPNSKYITNITPVGELLPLPYCLSREFLARDTRGYASVEGTYAHVYVGTDTTPPLFLNRRQQQCRAVTDQEPMVVSVTVAAPPPS
jgi:hypothetical protein